MRRVEKIVCTVIVIMIAFTFNGCSLLHSNKAPESITVDGIKYVGGFYDNDELYCEIVYREDSTRLFEKGNYYWWHLDDSTFDMYFCRHKESLWWHPAAYCRQDQYDEVKNYYKNTDNYDYYLGLYLEDEVKIKLPDDADRSLVERAIEFSGSNDGGALSNGGLITGNKVKEVTLYLENEQYSRPTVYRVSKDGLFTTYRTAWIYYKDNLYDLNYVDGSSGAYHLYVLDDDVNAYIVQLIKANGLN